MRELIIWIALASGNFFYQFFWQQDYETAIERTYFQALALLLVYLARKFL